LLRFLSIHSFAGAFPLAWGSTPPPVNSSHVIRLGRNGLQGELPSSWQALVYRAAVVEVQSNQLNGGFPLGWWTTTAFGNEGPSLQYFNIR
jgi:hypothetical protein